MKYFGISHADRIDEIGFYPQTNFISGQDSLQSNASDQETPLINGHIEINHNAIPTNFLDRSSITKGIIVDSKLKGIIENHNLPPHKFQPIKTTYHGKELEYYWFTFVSNTRRYIDFSRSKFKIIAISNFKELGELELTSIEFKNSISNGLSFEHSIVIKSIYLNGNFPQYDIIDLDKITPGIFVSDRLLSNLKEAGMTGFVASEYKPIITE